MNEKKNKREWVKSAAIVFLSIMLVLTFFSNTIMNYSLPEVAAQYIMSDSITAKIRGNGVIESNDPYQVMYDKIRKVESVEVREGDEVQKGDVLCLLSEEDSEELEAAKALLEAAQAEYDRALVNAETDISVLQSGGKTISAESYKNHIITLKQEIETAEAEYKAAKQLVDDLTQWGNALSTQISITPSNSADTSKEKKAVADAEAAIDAAELAIQAAINEQNRSKNEQTKIQKELDKQLPTVSGGDANVIASLEKALADEKAKEAKAIETQGNEEVKKADAEYQLQKAQIALNNKIASGDTSGTLANLTNQLNDNTAKLFHATNEMNDKAEILEEKKTALAEYVDNAYDSMNLSDLLQKVKDARAEVERLEAEAVGGEILAPVSGTIISVNVTSGKDTPGKGEALFTMQQAGDGYTLSFSLTNEQARTVSVGDVAEPVNSWRYDDMEIVLESIRPDKTNPSQNKLLVFSVSGDNVAANQSLNVSVGQKSATYDMVVPNSAIREDNNGTFVLIVESKSSPIGTRYTATRVDVQVVASDDTKSAITGALYGYEFVITTSTKPVEAGQQVRLSEN